MTPFVAARSTVAPTTDPFPLVRAKIVNVNVEVPSAFSTLALELIRIVATVAFGAMIGVVGVVGVVGTTTMGALALPPPPPQAAKTAAKNVPARHFKIFILNFLKFNLRA